MVWPARSRAGKSRGLFVMKGYAVPRMGGSGLAAPCRMAYEARMPKSATRCGTGSISSFLRGLATLLLWAALLGACGPREIGHGMAAGQEHCAERPSAAEQMRYPLMGSGATQFMLYQYNRSEVMEQIRNWHMDQFSRLHGPAPTPDDPAYRASPREASPFRQ